MPYPVYLPGRKYQAINDKAVPKKPVEQFKGNGVITTYTQACKRATLVRRGIIWVDTYYYDSPTEAVQAGAVFELYNSSSADEKKASGRRAEKDFLHPTLGMLYAADVFDY